MRLAGGVNAKKPMRGLPLGGSKVRARNWAPRKSFDSKKLARYRIRHTGGVRPMTAQDPRTVIAVRLSEVFCERRSIATLSLTIAQDLAHWLTMKADEFDALDDRAHGYRELAERLTAR